MNLGANNFSGVDYLTGDICEVLVYDRELTASEILQAEAYLTR